MLNREKITSFITEIRQEVRMFDHPEMRKSAFNEAIQHFAERAKSCPDQLIRHEAVVAILSALRDNYWGGSIGFYKALCEGTNVEIVAKITTSSGEVKELLLDPPQEKSDA
jgi:hypothetical protein